MSRRVIVFGSGNGARQAFAALGPDDEVVAVLDNDEARVGRCVLGHRVQSPAIIGRLSYDAVLVGSMYFDEIARGLRELGVAGERIQRGIPAAAERPLPATDLAGYRPLVSVITPAYNRVGTVAPAVRSVLDQTYADLELLFIDDGSDDGTADIANRAAAGDRRFRLVRNPHLGVSAARNTGLRLARGELIAYLDSDNCWHAEYLMRMLAWFATGRYQLGYCASNVFDNVRGQCYLRFSQYDRARLERENYIDLNVLMHHRGLVDLYGPFDEAMSRLVDWDLVLRYTVQHAPFTMNAALVDYHVDPNVPRISTSESFADNLRIMRERSGLQTARYRGVEVE
ncbi:MAG: glycosyltransferase family 2 protein [Gammaproteobacteria bacterium]|nr:glycosyltransferase family 2 protein [Gammaproteobacteria bacterium]